MKFSGGDMPLFLYMYWMSLNRVLSLNIVEAGVAASPAEVLPDWTLASPPASLFLPTRKSTFELGGMALSMGTLVRSSTVCFI